MSSPALDLAGLVRDPVRFTRGLLRTDPWPTQEAILRAVASHSRIAVKACHASGKTHTAAQAVKWWVTRFKDGIVVTTAPTWTQVERLLWGEIHKGVARSRIAFPPLNKTELGIGPENYALGLSTNEGVRFQGWHGRILVVLDEAPGVLPEIWEAIEGIRAGGQVHVLALGNPILSGGPFYDAFHQHRAGWTTFTISAFDTPNLEGCCLDNLKPAGEHVRYGSADPDAPNLLTMSATELATNVRPYLTTRAWVREKWEEWGAGHPLFESKVLGQFPSQAEDALIPLAWLDRARDRKPGHDHEPLDAGVDVAGPGEDETVVSVRQGPNRIALQAWHDRDPRGDVAAFLRPYRERLRSVNVDEVGQGYYFMLHLQDLGFPVRGVSAGATDGVLRDRFANWKAQLFWHLRERAQNGDLGGIIDGMEQAQLAVIRYEHDSHGRVVIESKEKLRDRGVKSPDRAEADMLAFAPPLPAPPARRPLGSRSFVSG